MSPERYKSIDFSGKGLTEDEVKEGWHFCWDWDGLLIGPGMKELEGCTCPKSIGTYTGKCLSRASREL